MPLEKGKSPEAFKHNIKAEMHAGKPQKQALAIAYSMKKRAKKMAMGGMAHAEDSGYEEVPEVHEEHNGPAMHEDADMIARIMHKRKQYMSEGGQVANQDEITAGFAPNEFDDLHLRDDLAENYTGANSGDEIGDEQEDADRADIISRIMRSRAKKDKMPRPA